MAIIIRYNVAFLTLGILFRSILFQKFQLKRASIMKANEIKKGVVINHNGGIYAVREVERSAPTARGGNTTYRITMFSIPAGQKLDLSLRADDDVNDIELIRRQVTFSYHDGDSFVFMDAEDFTQYYLSNELVGDDAGFIVENVEGYFISLIEDEPIALQLPQSIVMEIIDTAPELKGASATKRTKPAKLSTGIEVPVPEYIATGDKIRINTDTKEYMGRA